MRAPLAGDPPSHTAPERTAALRVHSYVPNLVPNPQEARRFNVFWGERIAGPLCDRPSGGATCVLLYTTKHKYANNSFQGKQRGRLAGARYCGHAETSRG